MSDPVFSFAVEMLYERLKSERDAAEKTATRWRDHKEKLSEGPDYDYDDEIGFWRGYGSGLQEALNAIEKLRSAVKDSS